MSSISPTSSNIPILFIVAFVAFSIHKKHIYSSARKNNIKKKKKKEKEKEIKKKKEREINKKSLGDIIIKAVEYSIFKKSVK